LLLAGGEHPRRPTLSSEDVAPVTIGGACTVIAPLPVIYHVISYTVGIYTLLIGYL
jgi:hypothetical protein